MPRKAIATRPPEAAPTWAAQLTPREQRFVEEYVIDLNSKAAAIRAGLGKTPKSATEIASRMRKKAHVAAAISQLISERSGTTGVAVLNEIARLAFAKMTDFARVVNGSLVITDTADLTEDQQAAISEIIETVNENGRTIRIKLHDKLSALDKLAKAVRLYDEKDTRPPGDTVIVNNIGDILIERYRRMREKALESQPAQQTILPPPAAPKRAPAPPVIIDATAE